MNDEYPIGVALEDSIPLEDGTHLVRIIVTPFQTEGEITDTGELPKPVFVAATGGE